MPYYTPFLYEYSQTYGYQANKLIGIPYKPEEG